MTASSGSIAFASILLLITLIYHIFCALKLSKFFKGIKQKTRKRNLDDFSYKNIPETESNKSLFVRAPTYTEVGMSNVQDSDLDSDDSKNLQRKPKAKRVNYSNRLRESLLQD